MATSKIEQEITSPLHIENTVRSLGKDELKLGNNFYTYRDMLTDSQISGALSLIQGLVNKTNFTAQVDEKASKKVQQWTKQFNKNLNELSYSKVELINYILSMLSYGHSMFEIVLKRKQGLMELKDLSPIHPINVNKYVYDRNTLKHLEVNTPDNDGLIKQDSKAEKKLAGEKVLMFKLNSDLDNPLGRSMLDRVYVDWKSKQIASEYELIGIAKNLSGVVKLEIPIEYIQDWYNNPTSDNAKYVDSLLDQAELLHGGKSSVVMSASDVTATATKLFDIKQFGGDSGNAIADISNTISRFNTNILVSLYADVLSLGQSGSGSYSLADSKTSLLGMFIESLFSVMRSSFNKVITTCLEESNLSTEYVPYIVFDDVDERDIDVFSRAWQRLAQAGLVTPDEELETFLRDSMTAPKANYSKKLDNNQVPDANDRLETDKQK